jgi:hypothetical protein
MKASIISILLIASILAAQAQNITYAKQIIAKLCSEDFAGRGYVNEGDKKAANYIRDEFTQMKLSPLGERYFQNFGFPVVSYPQRVFFNADGNDLIPGEDFIINPGCPSVSGNFKVIRLDSAMIDNNNEFNKWFKKNLKNYFLIVDALKGKKFVNQERADAILKNQVNAKGLIFDNQETLVWGVSMDFEPYPIIYVKKDLLNRLILKITLNIDASKSIHGTQNVLGFIKGSVQPDSFIVVSAHYDHLGMMGMNAIFPGANDNASGIAMMLDLAKQYKEHPPEMSVVFIAFAAEEVGLIGSLFFTENPLVPLKKISLVLNLDLMASGDKGLTAVNGTIYPELFNLLQDCNAIGNYLPEVSARGKAMNSDHYYFSEKNVPALFFYLRGEYHQYHDVGDTHRAITLSKYNEAFGLVRDFMNARMKLHN